MGIDSSEGSCYAVCKTTTLPQHSYAISNHTTCGTPFRMGKGLSCVCFKRKRYYHKLYINITPMQQERLGKLKHRMKASFDSSKVEHQEALKSLWYATYPDQELKGLVSEQWKEMGWQGRDPSTDFRGAGFISLENLLFFAKTYTTSFQRLLQKKVGKRAAWEYPFAVAGVNITFMIMQMLDLDAVKPRTSVRAVFLQMLSAHSLFYIINENIGIGIVPLLWNSTVAADPLDCSTKLIKASMSSFSENEWTFDLLYCVAFMVMDKKWLDKSATYMEFNDVLKSTRSQLEKELLMGDVLRIEDIPSFALLC